ncbi:hydantoinase/oxoprolinase family protein [Geobacillus sp. Y412MC52]|uniref:hydantoinase/oxoprolinase family protein n=1 Tax=Geobacillus sp. (strain Y412MC52) TaxID=550542 RepID=UPI00018C1A8A|nr:hydantoinase/oxoprolinase family protein [Geobacillus sp. Y412MC52]ADU95962.1 5-oxoprolinase (ATP-hydrolyzing) [Geobacillus sp. Y412MC52]
MYRVAVDVGGTFTDVVLQNEETGEIFVTKVPSTPSDQSIGLMDGILKICREAGVSLSDIRTIIHGTTVATNAVLEGKGAKVGLITTHGFEQILHVARSWTPAPVSAWIGFIKPDPLADLTNTRGALERISAQGEIIRELDEDHIRRQIQELYEKSVESLTISLINSYANPVHEQRIREIATEINPDIPVSISYEILPEFREYERTLTTVMNSYVRPPMQKYLRNIENKLKENHMRSRVGIVRSDGGLMSISAAATRPVHTMLSGPSGGVTASAMIGIQAGFRNVISFDMGGTSTDVALTYDGKPRVSRETKVGTFPVKAPSLEVVSIGAGGGSIAHVPPTGALRVGPKSAGADPGPACYGRGGEEPTVTDANVVLGYLPSSLVGGEMKLDVEAAFKAVGKIAERLGIDVYRAAKGIYDIVNENMYGAIRVVSVEKGYDPRDFALIALGGAGPLHANALGRLSGSFPVIIPPTPGVLSALGFLQSDIRNEYSKTFIRTLSQIDVRSLIRELNELGKEAEEWLIQESVPKDQQTVSFEVDVRYFRQGYEISIQVDKQTLIQNGLGLLKSQFDKIHEKIYGFKMDIELEIVNLRAVAIGKVTSPSLPSSSPGNEDASHALIDKEHKAFFDGEFLPTPLYDRALLKPNNRIPGPAIVIQKDSTTLVLPGYVAVVDNHMNLLIKEEV